MNLVSKQKKVKSSSTLEQRSQKSVAPANPQQKGMQNIDLTHL